MSKTKGVDIVITMTNDGKARMQGHFSPRQAMVMLACAIDGISAQTGISREDLLTQLINNLLYMKEDIQIHRDSKKTLN